MSRTTELDLPVRVHRSISTLPDIPRMTRKRSRVKAFGGSGGAGGMIARLSAAVYIFVVADLVQAAPDAIGQQRHHTQEDHKCTDNPSYKSSFGGLPCGAFADLDCYAFRSLHVGLPVEQDIDGDGDGACVQCTNIPSASMLESGRTCADYSYAWTDRCNNEKSWWGKEGEKEYCQYSCWKNGSPYPNAVPCCPREDKDDDDTAMAVQQESGTATALLVDELLFNCPKSCGVDECEEKSYVYWENFFQDVQEIESVTTSSSSLLIPADKTRGGMLYERLNGGGTGASSYSTQQATEHHIPATCQAGWSPSCQDDDQYRCHYGLGCNAYRGYDCTKFIVVGYSFQQVADLIAHCPCTCGIPCGTHAAPPQPALTDKFAQAFIAKSTPTVTPPIGELDAGGDGDGAGGGGSGIQLNNVKPRTMDIPVETSGSSATPGGITVTLESQFFELTLYPMLASLDFASINDLNTMLDDQIIANLDDIMGPSNDRTVEMKTFLLFQILGGGKLRHRRILSESSIMMGDGGASMADAIDDAMLDLLHDGDIGETNRALSSDNGNAYEEQTLHLGIMKIVHVTVPSIEGGEEGLYDASLVPDPDTLDLAVLTVFTNLQQSKRLISRLQGANSQHFSSLKRVEFIGFIAAPTGKYQQNQV